MQKTHECIYCVVDMHAITVKQDPEVLKNNILEVAAAFIASGIDPTKSIILLNLKRQLMRNCHGYLIAQQD